MNFLETILLIEERGEKVISEKLSSIQTNGHYYTRSSNGDWTERELTETEKLAKPPTPPQTIAIKEKKKDAYSTRNF
jgi:hypothetical protein